MNVAELIFILLATFLFIRLMVVLVNLFTSPKLKAVEMSGEKDVSVLIPARNEERSIGKLLESLIGDLQVREIIVLDDNSEDATAEVVQGHCSKHDHVKLVKGNALPAGWLGKNYACHQLAQYARGRYWLFVDADVELVPGAIEAAITRMNKQQLSLLSIFPDQQMDTTGEKLVIPFMHYLLLSLLPLQLVLRSSRSSLAAANGQFMMFDADDYIRNNWHEQVKDKVVEDVEIMRRVKKQGLKGEVLLGDGLVKCRMYHGGREAIKGFSKNLLPGLGNLPALIIYFLLICWLWPVVIFIDEPMLLIPVIVAAIAIRIFISLMGNQSVLVNTVLHPVQLAAFSFIAVNSVYLHLSGKVVWKGRKI